MKRKTIWIIVLVLAAAAIVLAIALPGAARKGEASDPNRQEQTADQTEPTPEPTVDPELPLDDSPLIPVTDSGASDEEEQNGNAQPGGNGQAGEDGGGDPTDAPEERDEDELPPLP